jgi:next-to-BRCA1 protein 1
MAATNNVPVTMETPIVVKVLFRGQTKKFKLPLKDLGANVLPDKVSDAPITRGCCV